MSSVSLEDQLDYFPHNSFVSYIAQFKLIISCPIRYGHGKEKKTPPQTFFQCAGLFHV